MVTSQANLSALGRVQQSMPLRNFFAPQLGAGTASAFSLRATSALPPSAFAEFHPPDARALLRHRGLGAFGRGAPISSEGAAALSISAGADALHFRARARKAYVPAGYQPFSTFSKFKPVYQRYTCIAFKLSHKSGPFLKLTCRLNATCVGDGSARCRFT